ncbi:Trehalose-6-phosphate synthase component TPS1 subunit [Trachipleistophora hominis]|uniref:Trehalose-6-phosphate synthase component TPS1 subunit n=1 Tax=Trachipleistophora hominis TaxID=72359 RepID=L7JRY4_TRAHO|nr:Trehalose-6-phosphate synthase component TPS1 subunit [Trachipleistophora hominis]
MRLIIVSNRLPISIKRENGEFVYKRNSGGLVTGLVCVAKSIPFTWIGNIPGNFTQEEQQEIRTNLNDNHSSIPLFVPEALNKMSYDGYCNKILWPLFHFFTDIVVYDNYEYYREYNEMFCKTVLENAGANDIVWVHDYHLMLLPALLKKYKPSLRVGFFLHIPFPSFETFRLLPEHREILLGILGADLIAFHTLVYSHNFRQCCEAILGNLNEQEKQQLTFVKPDDSNVSCPECSSSEIDRNFKVLTVVCKRCVNKMGLSGAVKECEGNQMSLGAGKNDKKDRVKGTNYLDKSVEDIDRACQECVYAGTQYEPESRLQLDRNRNTRKEHKGGVLDDIKLTKHSIAAIYDALRSSTTCDTYLQREKQKSDQLKDIVAVSSGKDNTCMECHKLNENLPRISNLRCEECRNTEGIAQETDSEIESINDEKANIDGSVQKYTEHQINMCKCVGAPTSEPDDASHRKRSKNYGRPVCVECAFDRIRIDDREIAIKRVPIGIDPNHFRSCLEKKETIAFIKKYKEMFQDRFVLLGIDRVDYIKGIPNRLAGYEQFLRKNPEKKTVFIQVGVPSRTTIKEYNYLESAILSKVGRINSKYGGVTDSLVYYLNSSVKFEEMCALYSIADMCLVSSVRDGMNLVALEFVACSQNNGILGLSEFAGTASTLPGSIFLNPWDTETIVRAIEEGIKMDSGERMRRYKVNFENVTKFTAEKWAETNINYLLNYRK